MSVSESIKRVFATNIRTDLTEIVKKTRRLEIAVKIFTQKGFQAGGEDPITDEHLVAIGITAAELSQGKTVIDNLVALIDNADILNILRNDFGIEEPT